MISTRSAFPLLVVCLGVVVLLSLPQPAQASDPNSWGCETYWSGPSKNNSVTDCLKNQNRQSVWAKWLWIPALPLAVLILMAVFYPIVFICRQCCNMCGGRRRQPGICCSCESDWDRASQAQKDAAYTMRDHMCVKIPAFLICLLSVATIILIVRGGSSLEQATNDFEADLQSNGVDTFATFLSQFKTAVTNTTTGAYIAPASASLFDPLDSAMAKFQSALNSYDADYKKYTTQVIRIGMNVLAVVPFAFFVLLPVYASMNRCMRCWPCCTTCIYFFIGICFCILSAIFLFLAVVLAAGCGEVSRQKVRMPGIMQWYVYPYCEDLNQFGSMYSSVESAEALWAKSFCQALSLNCSSAANYDSVNDPDKTFVCSFTYATAATTCPDYSTALSVAQTVTPKSGSPACTSCTFYSCETQCVSPYRGSATLTMNYLNASEAWANAAVILNPLLDCNYLLDVGSSVVSKGCPELRDGFWMIGFGCFFACMLFAVGIIVLFRGQKVFFKREVVHNPADAYAK